MRLNKYLGESGSWSRRQSDDLIAAGKVTVNGEVATLGAKVEPSDEVRVEGELVGGARKKDAPVYIALNKPIGITCTTERHIEGNIIEFIGHAERIFPIGRLDKESEGLILLTNDGDIVNEVLRSEFNHEKEYVVEVDRLLGHDFVELIEAGIHLVPEGVTKKCKVTLLGPKTFNIVLTQGLNRQIRRMCSELDYQVVALQRIRFMNIKLGNLAIGKWRSLTPAELEGLRPPGGLNDKKANNESVPSTPKAKPNKSGGATKPNPDREGGYAAGRGRGAGGGRGVGGGGGRGATSERGASSGGYGGRGASNGGYGGRGASSGSYGGRGASSDRGAGGGYGGRGASRDRGASSGGYGGRGASSDRGAGGGAGGDAGRGASSDRGASSGGYGGRGASSGGYGGRGASSDRGAGGGGGGYAGRGASSDRGAGGSGGYAGRGASSGSDPDRGAGSDRGAGRGGYAGRGASSERGVGSSGYGVRSSSTSGTDRAGGGGHAGRAVDGGRGAGAYGGGRASAGGYGGRGTASSDRGAGASRPAKGGFGSTRPAGASGGRPSGGRPSGGRPSGGRGGGGGRGGR